MISYMRRSYYALFTVLFLLSFTSAGSFAHEYEPADHNHVFYNVKGETQQDSSDGADPPPSGYFRGVMNFHDSRMRIDPLQDALPVDLQ